MFQASASRKFEHQLSTYLLRCLIFGGTHIRHCWWRNELVSPTTGTTLCVTTMIDVDLMSLRRHGHVISSYHWPHLLHWPCLPSRWAGGAVASNRSKLDLISTTSPFVESGGGRFSTPWSPTVDLKSALQRSWSIDESCLRVCWGSSFEFFHIFQKTLWGTRLPSPLPTTLRRDFEEMSSHDPGHTLRQD